MDKQAIYTIGYGTRSLDEMIDLLRRHEITFLVDVRSAPYSRFKPEFSREALDSALAGHGIRYVFMGDLLGGRPEQDECYVNGKVDYARMRESEPFRQGIDRLRTAWEKSLRICLMCSEARPEECHRGKLIGAVLDAEGITVQHIDGDGNLQSQDAVFKALSGNQMRLFDEPLTSRKKYRAE